MSAQLLTVPNHIIVSLAGSAEAAQGWHSIPSSLVSAVAGLVGVLVGSGISAWVSRHTHSERLVADQRLAERRVEADIALAERKFALDGAFAAWKRKAELAEQTLVLFNEARDALIWARSPGFLGGDGMARPEIPEETAGQRDACNTYFIPVERLTKRVEVFAGIDAKMYQFSAYFGRESIDAFKQIRGSYNLIISSANILIRNTNEDGTTVAPGGQDACAAMRKTLWGTGDRPDDFDRAIDSAVETIEALCKPVLETVGP